MTGLYRQISLTAGVAINIYDLTRRYYGDFFLVKLEVCCEIPASSGVQLSDSVLASGEISGSCLTYKRYLKKMGVPSTEVDTVKELLLTDFESNSLPYILSSTFPEKLLASNLLRIQKPIKTYQGNNQ